MDPVIRAILIVAGVLVLAGIVIFLIVRKRKGKEPDLMILDGPGSYVERLDGTIAEITDETDYEFTIALRVDETERDRYDETVCAKVSRSDIPEGEIYQIGDHVRIGFAGGMHWEGDPILITPIYYIYQITETEDN